MSSIVAGIVGLILVLGPKLELFEGHPVVDRVLAVFGLVLLGLMLLDGPTVAATMVEHAQRAADELLELWFSWFDEAFDPTVPPSTTTTSMP